jgi:hypothetical protein
MTKNGRQEKEKVRGVRNLLEIIGGYGKIAVLLNMKRHRAGN